MSEVLISTALSVAYRQSAGETPAIRWSRLHFRIAGVSPASGCTQPPMIEVDSQQSFCLPCGKLQPRRLRSFSIFCTKKLFHLSLKKIANTYFVKQISVNGYKK
jgi:hypothetical protein